MNNDNYLNFLYQQINSHKLEEKNKIHKFLNSKKIKSTDIIKKEVKIKKSIVAIEINGLNKYILIKDIPINFIMSYGILIGDNTKLIEFKLKDKNEIYISNNIIFTILKDKIDTNSIKNINPKELQKKRCIFHFKRSEIIEELKEYMKSKKKIDLNQIHLTDSNKIENFIPNIKQHHFKIANILKIPTIPLIKNSFLKETTININDYESQNKIIKPIKTIEEKIIWDFEKKTNEKTYKDISKEITIQIDRKNIINKILQTTKTNFNKEKIIEEIKKIKEIEISEDTGEIPIPLFKAIETQKYVKIKDCKDFFEITGVKFKLDNQKLKNIYIQTIKSKQAKFRNKYLCKNLEKTFKELNKINKIIKFHNTKDLIIKLTYSAVEIEEIIKIEEITENQQIELKKSIKQIIKKTIISSVKYNKLPYEIIPQTEMEKYYSSIANTLNQIHQDYEKYPSKKQLIKQTINKINQLLETIKTQIITEKELFPLAQTSLILIKIIAKINLELSREFENLFTQYFKKIKIDLRKSHINKEIEELINSITLANKLIKKQNITILKKQEFNSELLNKKIKVIEKEPETKKRILQPNIKKIKSIFPYSSNEIITQIKTKKISEINYETLQIKGKIIPIKDEYFNIKKIYKKYKQLESNKYLIILRNN